MPESKRVVMKTPRRASVVEKSETNAKSCPARPLAGAEKTRSEKVNNFGSCFDVLFLIWDFFDLVPEKCKKNQAAIRSKQVDKWVEMSGKTHWVKFMKYKLAAWFAAHLDQTLPEQPKGLNPDDKAHVLLGGTLGRMARHYIRMYPVVGDDRSDEKAAKGMEFLNSVLNAKKGMPRMSDEDLQQARRDTFSDLTREHAVPEGTNFYPKSWADYSNNNVEKHVTFENLLFQIRRTVKEVFGRTRYTDGDRLILGLPSTNSNYTFSRGNGGGYQVLAESGVLDSLRKPGGYLTIGIADKRYDALSLSQRMDEIVNLEEGRAASVLVDPTTEVLWNVHGGALSKLHDQEGEEWDDGIYVADNLNLLRAAADMTRNVTEAAILESPFAKTVALAEALKARVITAGPGLTGFALRPIWKKMHSTMREQKLFKLIGQPDTAELMRELLGAPKGDRNYFVSGDYKGATNAINPRASEAAVEAVSDCFDLEENERILFKRSLTEHILLHPDTKEEMKQLWGQLMGSVTSFPILCLINAAVTRWSVEIHEDRDIPLHNLNAAINGDDVVIRTKRGIESTWRTVTAMAGLIESVGKTFFHPHFFNINSRSYTVLARPKKIWVDIDMDRWPKDKQQAMREAGVTKVEREQPYEKTGFINMGLVIGLKRSDDGKTSASKFDDLGSKAFSPAARAKEIATETPKSVLRKVWTHFKRVNRKLFESFRLPWYIPVWAGGLGLPRLFPEDQNSQLDLRIMMSLILGWKDVHPINLSVGTPWQIRKIVRGRLPSPSETVEGDVSGVDAYRRATQMATLNLLFDSNLDFEDVYKEIGTDPIYKALQHNRKLWVPPKNGKLPPPIDQRVLDSMKTYESLPIVFTSDIGDYWAYMAEQVGASPEGPNVGLLKDIQEPVLAVPDVGARAPTCKELSARFLSSDSKSARDQIHVSALY